MFNNNIYYRFLNDSAVFISEFEIENSNVINELKQIDSGKLMVSNDEKKLLRVRYRTNYREINKLYGNIYSLKIACIRESNIDPCKDAKKLFFNSNNDYIEYLINKMKLNGYIYNENIIEDIRNMYMRSAKIEDKYFNINVGSKIRITSLIKGKKKKTNI